MVYESFNCAKLERVISVQNRPTMRAADGGEFARFTSVFLAST